MIMTKFDLPDKCNGYSFALIQIDTYAEDGYIDLTRLALNKIVGEGCWFRLVSDDVSASTMNYVLFGSDKDLEIVNNLVDSFNDGYLKKGEIF